MARGQQLSSRRAINELEMWQAETFDPAQIDKEFGWAESSGMNTMRVFLHDLLWQQDSAGFKKRIDQFLEIASRHHIRRFSFCSIPAGTLIPNSARSIRPSRACIIPDGCSPGRTGVERSGARTAVACLRRGVVGAFASDPRVLAWDVWNEPSNTNDGAYAKWSQE